GDIPSCIPGATADNANGRPCEQAVPANGVCARGTLKGTGAAARCVETPELVTFAFFGVQGAQSNTDGAKLAASTSADTFTATRSGVRTRVIWQSLTPPTPRRSPSGRLVRPAPAWCSPSRRLARW